MGFNDSNEDTRESEAMRKIFVGGLSRSTQEDAFFEHFTQYGEIVDKVIIVDPHTKESRGFGFITYSTSSSVENAFKNRPHTLDNKPLDIKRAMPREFNTAGAHAKTKKLFIGGVAPDMTEEDIRAYIESRHDKDTIGKIETIFIAKDKATGKNKGFGFLDCSDNDFADRLAISESTCHLNGKKMNIKKAEPREGDDNGAGGRGGGRGAMRGGRGRGADRGGAGGRGGGFSRGGGRGGYEGGYAQQSNQNYSTAYPGMQQNAYSAGGYGAGGGGGGGGYVGGFAQQQDQGSYGGAGYGAGGYGQAAAGGYGGYSQGDGGYGQGGGYGGKPRGAARGGAARGGAQRYQPY